jgi:hypothetical protein
MSTMSADQLQIWLSQSGRQLEHHEGWGYAVTRGAEARGFRSLDEMEPFYRKLFGQDQARRRHKISPPPLGHYSSSERPEAIVGWANSYARRSDPAVGPLFWKTLHQEWDGFDRIDHRAFQRLFRRFRPWWQAPGDGFYNSLPEKLQIFRGTDAGQPVGLSWTLELPVAESFAMGHRSLFNKRPMILRAIISKAEIALASNARKEREVVLFVPPSSVTALSI